MKTEAQVLVLAYKDERTPLAAKFLIGITVGYLLSPIDLIPDFIPVLGLLDDLLIVPLLITISIKLIPATVLSDARATIKREPLVLRRTNILFALLIIVFWLIILYFSVKYFRS